MKKSGLKYEIIPYFISSHPGCMDSDMNSLATEVKSLGIKPEQVQDFTPTPMTLSTLMYYTGEDPYTGKKVYVARSVDDKRKQKEYFFWYKKPADKSYKPVFGSGPKNKPVPGNTRFNDTRHEKDIPKGKPAFSKPAKDKHQGRHKGPGK